MLAKRRLRSQAFLAETVETGDKSCDVTDNIFRAPCMFWEESLGNINAQDVAFPERVSPRILSFESIDYFGTSEYFGGREKNFDGEANWSGVVNFHCMKMSLVMRRRWLKWRDMFIGFSCIYTSVLNQFRNKSSNTEYSTVDQVGREKYLARKHRFVFN